MKKECIIIFCTILFCATAACKKAQTENQVQTQIDSTSQNTTTINEQKLQDYQLFLSKLDTTNLLSSSKAGLEFVEQFKETDVESNDSAYALFKNFHELMISSQQNTIDKNNNAYLELFSGEENKANKAIKEQKELLEKNGFYLGTVEGYVYVATLPEFQKKYVFEKLSPAMQSYFIQSQKEETEGTASDGGLLVEPKVLSERLIFWEMFLSKYPNFRWKDIVNFQINANTNMLLNGMDNTPAFHYETQVLDSSYKVAYDFLITKNPETKSAKLFSEYYTILSQNNLKDSPKAKKHREKINK